ncbi:LysR family transcriptional regulator [Kitasatospora sp. NPDC051853]|uniref:LysR family transcriptional regulator n=1 Tax=Kitasatospora sp. NPDC051853 TaxID=3364058 RepID=UPI0037AB4B84
MPRDLHPRLLRGFVATAETLHFGRAAERLHLAQQALSRDVRALEEALGRRLFDRTTRSVRLTPEGERMLPKVRELLALQDELLDGPDVRRPLLVDLGNDVDGDDLTAVRVLAAAREACPGQELLARFHGGLAAAAGELLAYRLDASFGRYAGLPSGVRAGLAQLPVRLEEMAVVLPLSHPLAGLERVPLAALAGHPVDVCAGNPTTTEWTDLGRRLLDAFGLVAAAPRTPPVGVDEVGHYLARHGEAMLTTTGGPGIPGAVTLPLVDPVPLSLVSLVHRPGERHPALRALREAAGRLGAREGWLRRPAGGWLPAEDAALLGGDSGISPAFSPA